MPKIVGHRGARNLWPENSLTGFRRLCEMGVESVEFDVHQSKDGELFVIHDPTLDRTTTATGVVGALTASELAEVRLRDLDECVPRLDAVLDILEPAGLELWIEMKTDFYGAPYPGIAQRLVDVLRRRRLGGRAFLTSFVPEHLETFKALWPEIRVLASLDRRSVELLGGLLPAVDRFASIPGAVLAIEKSLLDPMMRECVDKVGATRIAAWVPNDIEDLTYWLRQPVGHVATDRPDLALQARAELASSSATEPVEAS